MVGGFLEFGLGSQPVAQALQFYLSIGFRSVTVGDILDHPYAVVSDGDICIGLHEWEHEEPLLTFVRPDLQDHLPALRRRRIELEFSHLAADEFNRLGFRDPSGQLVTLLEARTFSPGSSPDERSVCGTFLEFSMATRSVARAREFWEGLGLDVVDEGEQPHHRVRLQGRGLTVGFHEGVTFGSGLTFEADGLTGRTDYMKAKGLTVRSGTPFRAARAGSATLLAPGGNAVYLLEGRTDGR